MVWIGTKETKMDNLVFSIGDQRLADPKKSVLSTTCVYFLLPLNKFFKFIRANKS